MGQPEDPQGELLSNRRRILVLASPVAKATSSEGPISIQGRKGFYLDYQDGFDKFRYIMIPARKSQNVYTIVCKFRVDNFAAKLPEAMRVVQTIRFRH